jgi:hypothetical protein
MASFLDLVCVGTFARTLMLRKDNKKVLVVQCIGFKMVFYLVCEHAKGIAQMAEILNMDVPREIGELLCLLQKVDDFKRLYLCLNIKFTLKPK